MQQSWDIMFLILQFVFLVDTWHPQEIKVCHANGGLCSLKLLASSRDEEQAAEVW